MNRNEAIALLEEFAAFLSDSGYIDSDYYYDNPTPMDQFITSPGFKRKYPVEVNNVKNAMGNRYDEMKKDFDNLSTYPHLPKYSKNEDDSRKRP